MPGCGFVEKRVKVPPTQSELSGPSRSALTSLLWFGSGFQLVGTALVASTAAMPGR
jgi:hypothetical protein